MRGAWATSEVVAPPGLSAPSDGAGAWIPESIVCARPIAGEPRTQRVAKAAPTAQSLDNVMYPTQRHGLCHGVSRVRSPQVSAAGEETALRSCRIFRFRIARLPHMIGAAPKARTCEGEAPRSCGKRTNVRCCAEEVVGDAGR